jgi:hypothetical protein
MDDDVGIEGYDGIDDGPSYSPSPGRKNIPSPGRRGGKKTLSSSSGMRSGRHSRPIGRSFRLNIDPRKLAGLISSVLVLAMAGVIAVAAILYFTFSSGWYPAGLSPFYGALAAAMVFVFLLAYAAIRLLGSGD